MILWLTIANKIWKSPKIITTHMDEVLKLPNCVGEKAFSLRLIYDKIILFMFEGCAQYGSLLIPVIMSKVPNDIKLRMAHEN